MSETTDENLTSINEQQQQHDDDETTDESYQEVVVEDGIVTKSDNENYINDEDAEYEEVEGEEIIVPKEDDEDEEIDEEEEEEEEDASSVLANGLDPMATHLISSSRIVTPSNLQQTPPPENEIIISKINREVRNLQINTNNSGDLYSSLSFDSPRRAKKVIDKLTPDDVIEDMDDDEKSEKSLEEAPKSPSVERLAVSSTSDSTAKKDHLKTNGTLKKSKIYIRTPVKKRKRTITRQLIDEMSITSDREDLNEDEDHDDETESESRSEVINQTSFESRSIKQPPKVSDFNILMQTIELTSSSLSQVGWDSFCFKCHDDQAVLSLACTKCRCSYHRICVRNNPIPRNSEEFVCQECRDMETAESSSLNKYGHERIEPKKLSEMLGLILSKLLENNSSIEEFRSEIVLKSKESGLIVNNMSFTVMESRIKENFYSSSESFIHDIKQLEHNWTIVDRNKAKILKPILKGAVSEINELESCVYCYEDSFSHHDWFVRVCKRPHLLVWAKLKGYPYWPAKIMSIDNQRQQADVRFFGAHDRAWVPTNCCMVFCEKDPNKAKESVTPNAKMTSKTQKGFFEAIKEKDEYIENLRRMYGFNSAPFKTILDGNNLAGHLEMLLPSYKEVKEEKSQKEKLLIKLVKRQSSNKYQVEPKGPAEMRKRSTSTNSKDNKTHYKVVNKDENDVDDQHTKKLNLILKRSNNDKDLETFTSIKKLKTTDNISETSESSNVSSRGSASKRIELKRLGKAGRKKSALARNDSIRKSIDVQVPIGTDEITHLKDGSEEPAAPPKLLAKALTTVSTRGRKRAQSTFHRRLSLENEAKKLHHLRRMSVTTYDKKMNKAIEVVKASSPPYIKTRASDSSAVKKNAVDTRGSREKRKIQLIATPDVEPGKKRGRGRRSVVATEPAAKPTPKNNREENSAKVPEKEPEKNVKKEHAEAAKRVEPEPSVSIEKIAKPSKSKEPSPSLQNSTETEAVFKEPTPEIITNGSVNNTKENANGFDPKVVIKCEPVSDSEDNTSSVDVESHRSFSVRDVASLLKEKPARKQLITNLYNDNENTRPKARKSFINCMNAKQVDKLNQWMTSIPQEVISCQSSRAPSPANSVTVSNRSSPISNDANSTGSNQIINNNTSQQTSVTPQPPSNPVVNIPPLIYAAPSSSSSRRNSSQQVSPNSVMSSAPPPHTQAAITNSTRLQDLLPRLVPRPQGVFVSDGSAFNRDNGPVSRMLTDNAYRITDYFKNVLLDTVQAFSPEYPIAENLMLRSENEKLQREMQNVKSDCQQKMHELRREHQEELEDMKRKNGKFSQINRSS